jgi:xylulokinase
VEYLLGIDLGTSTLKVGLFDEKLDLVSLVRRSIPSLPGPDGQVEQDPSAWWMLLCDALHEIVNQVDTGRIAGVGPCGFHHCPVLLDGSGTPVRPVVQLHDVRLIAAHAELERSGKLVTVEALSRSRISTGHFPVIYALLQKIAPRAVERTRWIIAAKDYLRFRLTGEIGSELCDASGFNLFEVGGHTWSDRLCEEMGVDRHCLPRLGAPWERAGVVTPQAAHMTGLRPGLPVAYGGGDSHCALLGMGCTKPGDVGMLLGTNATLRMVYGQQPLDQGNRVWTQRHVVPGLYTASASTMAGASVLAWFVRGFFPEWAPHSPAQMAHLSEIVAGIPPGSEGLLCLPYIYGERSPFFDPQIAGSLIGFRPHHTRAHALRAVMEGVGFVIADCLQLLGEVGQQNGQAMGPLRIGGGGSQDDVWLGILANCLARPLVTLRIAEVGSLGAAMLGAVAAGWSRTAEELAGTLNQQKDEVLPNVEAMALYSKARHRASYYLSAIRAQEHKS